MAFLYTLLQKYPFTAGTAAPANAGSGEPLPRLLKIRSIGSRTAIRTAEKVKFTATLVLDWLT